MSAPATDGPHPQVLAIVVNHEGATRTIDCVRSLRTMGWPGLGIVIVDSGSRDDSVAVLGRELPDVPVIALGVNRGYAAALNVGIRHGLETGAQLLWLLNNDISVDRDALAEAVRVATLVPRSGIVTSSQRAPTPGEGPDADARAGGTPYAVTSVHGRLRDRHVVCDGSCTGDGWHMVDVVTGAALLVRADVIREIGLLDERFFHFGEDDELAERARRAGFGNLLACRSRVWHARGSTLAAHEPQAEYYRLRNLVLLKRWTSGWSFAGLLLRPGYARAVAGTWLRVRHDARGRLAFRSALRHALRERSGRVDLPSRAPSPRRRILIVTHSAGTYGAERSLLTMIATLPKEDFEVVVVLPRRGPLADALRQLGAHPLVIRSLAWRARRSGIVPFVARFWSSAAASVRIARLIAVCRVDLVCTWTLGLPAGAFAARLTARPHIWYARETLAGNASMAGQLPAATWLRLVERLSDAVVSNSEATRSQFGQRARGVRHVVVPSTLGPGWQPTRRERPSGAVPAKVAVIGAVAPHKRTIDALRAFARLRDGGTDATLVLWGDGPAAYRDEVRREADRLGLDGSVSMPGFSSDPDVYLDADIVLAPSYPETFGLAVLEAMSRGIPVVAARSDGLAEMAGPDGVVLVDPGDTVAMATAAARILAADATYEERARAATQRASVVVAAAARASHGAVIEEVLAARGSALPHRPEPTDEAGPPARPG